MLQPHVKKQFVHDKALLSTLSVTFSPFSSLLCHTNFDAEAMKTVTKICTQREENIFPLTFTIALVSGKIFSSLSAQIFVTVFVASAVILLMLAINMFKCHTCLLTDSKVMGMAAFTLVASFNPNCKMQFCWF